MGTTNQTSLMMMDMGLSAINGIAGMLISAQERKVQKIMDDYNNTMAALSASESHNALTQNEIAIQDQAKLAEAQDQSLAMIAKEDRRVAAAATGIEGNSVEAGLHSVDRAKAQKSEALSREQSMALRGIGQQRRQVDINLAYGKAITILPNQTPSQLLGLSANLLDIYKSYQPPTS